MELVKPAEIAGKIITLANEAQLDLTIVSPYADVSRWPKMEGALRRALERGVPITFFARADAEHPSIRALGIIPILIPMLHAKLYMNESAAVVSSMNLVRASDERSIDIGYYTDDRLRLGELRRFISTYLGVTSSPTSELAFVDYYRRMSVDLRSLSRTRFIANTDGRNFISDCGLVNEDGQKTGEWLYFHPTGLIARRERWNEGVREQWDDVRFGSGISSYDIILSLSNFVRGLYGVDTSELFFQNEVGAYVGGDRQKLYDHINEVLGMRIQVTDHLRFEDLANEIKWRCRGNHGPCPDVLTLRNRGQFGF